MVNGGFDLQADSQASGVTGRKLELHNFVFIGAVFVAVKSNLQSPLHYLAPSLYSKTLSRNSHLIHSWLRTTWLRPDSYFEWSTLEM